MFLKNPKISTEFLQIGLSWLKLDEESESEEKIWEKISLWA
jgi:hypothetical protein